MSVVLLCMTDGRDELLAQTIHSANEQLRGIINRRVIHTDAGDEHLFLLKALYGPYWEVIGGERLGFGGAINRAWTEVAKGTESYVYHLEDDFIHNRPVPLPKMVDVLEQYPHILQLVLRRQPWNDAEKAAGGICEQWPDEYTDMEWLGNSWLEHRLFVSSNPSLWRMSDVKDGWPTIDKSEAIYSARAFVNPTTVGAFWGKRDSGEWVTHIGNDRVGEKY